MEKIVALCKRKGFIFQASEIYGGINGFWDYGPLGVELKKNIKEAWWRDMVTGHDDLAAPAGAPESYEMVGLDCTIIMHPQVWKCSGHYDLFVDKMVDCRESKKRYRYDQVPGRWVEAKGQKVFVTTSVEENHEADIEHRTLKFFNLRAKDAGDLAWQSCARRPGLDRDARRKTDADPLLILQAYNRRGPARGPPVAAPPPRGVRSRASPTSRTSTSMRCASTGRSSSPRSRASRTGGGSCRPGSTPPSGPTSTSRRTASCARC